MKTPANPFDPACMASKAMAALALTIENPAAFRKADPARHGGKVAGDVLEHAKPSAIEAELQLVVGEQPPERCRTFVEPKRQVGGKLRQQRFKAAPKGLKAPIVRVEPVGDEDQPVDAAVRHRAQLADLLVKRRRDVT